MRTTFPLVLASLLTACAAPFPLAPPQPPAASGAASVALQPVGSTVLGRRVPAPQTSVSRGSGDATAVQGILGVTFFDDMKFSRTDPMDPNTTIEADVSNMPTLGFGGHYRLFGDPSGFEGGLDGTLLFSWWRDSTQIVGAGGGNVIILVSTRMFIADVGFGLYGSQMLGDSVRLYAGVGPLVQFGDGKFEDELSSTTSSGFGVGLYGRAGVEFRIKTGQYFGVGVRGTSSEIDFGGSVGNINTDALQAYLTYTFGF